jgi:hypothetical protein
MLLQRIKIQLQNTVLDFQDSKLSEALK